MKGALLTAVLILEPFAPAALAGCRLSRLAELPVILNGLRPTITAKINGTDAALLLDSGAFRSVLSQASAARLHLRVDPAPDFISEESGRNPLVSVVKRNAPQFYLEGLGGVTRMSVTTVKDFTLLGVRLHDVTFYVGGSEPAGAMGILGQDLLESGDVRPDVEYDLGNGVVRLMRPEGCASAALAYWAGSRPYSTIDVGLPTTASSHLTGTAFLDGTKLHVIFDTGAERSIVSLGAAKRAGVSPGDPRAVFAGLVTGFGPRPLRTWVATFASFKLGDEAVRNARLRIGDIESSTDADMVIGADFFLAHRIYLANSQQKLYFTYEGGPVFNLGAGRRGAAPGEASAPGEDGASRPTDAAGFALRGAAFAARREFGRAIADLTRACELDPNEPGYFFQRGVAHWRNAEPALALSDLDRALELGPDNVAALVTRAAVRLSEHDDSAASADLDAADRLAPKEADVRLALGDLYLRGGRFTRAVGQYDLWIAAHAQDPRMANALSDRCLARASSGRHLEQALSDCNAALGLAPGDAGVRGNRGLAQFRLGHFAKAAADYDAELKSQPGNAEALYGRGVARLRSGKTGPGRADIAAAAVLQPRVAEESAKRGLAP